MKMKSFAMLVMPALVAASLAYVAPAMAEDTNNDGSLSTQQFASADNSSMGSGMSQGSGMGSGMSQGSDNSSNDSGNSSSTDQGSPDTATGDDDY